MLNVIFTLDYEIHGNGEGCPHALMVEPTDRILRLFDEYGAKLTIMADVGEILKFKEYKDTHGRDAYHYDKIAEQLQRAVRSGHDVQLHIHSSYFNAQAKEGRWAQDWSEYDFASLPYERMAWMVKTGKEFLETLLRPVDPSYRCIAFRAANWSVSPCKNVVRALADNGIKLDTSVFKYGRRNGMVSFDYTHAASSIVPWPVSSNDICKRDDAGLIWEVPIYSEKRWLGVFLTLGRIRRALSGRKHKVAREAPANGLTTASNLLEKLRKWMHAATSKHAWKADFNQCDGRQLVKAMGRALHHQQRDGSRSLPFVLIGHSKLFSSYNERSVRPLLAHTKRHPDRFAFGTLSGTAEILTPGEMV